MNRFFLLFFRFYFTAPLFPLVRYLHTPSCLSARVTVYYCRGDGKMCIKRKSLGVTIYYIVSAVRPPLLPGKKRTNIIYKMRLCISVSPFLLWCASVRGRIGIGVPRFVN